MSIEVFTSSSIELLASNLAADLDGASGESSSSMPDLFQQLRILVPSALIKKWVQRQISRHNSVAANLDIRFFEEGLWECLTELEVHSEMNGVSRLDSEPMTREILQYFLVGVLLAADAESPELSMVFQYISDKNEINTEDPQQARKLWHITNELARLLREYEYHQPELIRGWLSGQETGDSHLATGGKVTSADEKEVESCQRFLYRAVFSEDGLRDRLAKQTGRNFLSLPQYCSSVLDRLKTVDMNTWNTQRFNVFAISQFSSFHITLLSQLSRYFDWKIWHLNTVPGLGEGEITPSHSLQKLTSQWGRRGQDNTELLERLLSECDGQLQMCSGHDVRERGVEEKGIEGKSGPEESSTLKAVQDVLSGRFSQGKPPAPCLQDYTLQIAGCPGIYREVETVYNSIIHNMQNDQELKLTDIVVLVTDMSVYKPAVESVFSREPACLDYNLVDSSALEDSVFAQAVLNLLVLAEGTFSRRAVFELVLNPCFLSAVGMDRDEAMKWIEWAQQLNIFRGFDLQDKYIDSEAPVEGRNTLYTWQQGLQRLRLGRIMEVEESQDGEPAPSHFHETVPWSAMEVDDQGVERFSIVIERLFDVVGKIRKGPRPGIAWSRELLAAVNRFLTVPPDRREEAFVRDRLFRCLEFGSGQPIASSLQTLDQSLSLLVLGEKQDDRNGHQLSLPLVREFVQDSLGKIESRKGRVLADGVTISSLKPDRAVPFKVVYVLGLGEGKFPGRHFPFALDLRRGLPRNLGDVNTPDANRLAFLETLLSARNKLYLTWVNLDLQKDQQFFPCSLVSELLHGMEQDLFSPVEGDHRHLPSDGSLQKGGFRLVDIPLKGSSPKLVTISGKSAISDISDLLDRSYSTMDSLVCYRELMETDSLKASDSQRDRIREAIRNATPEFNVKDPSGPEGQVEMEFVTIAELARFLDNPVDASLRRHLRIYEDREEDFSIPEDEPFGTVFPFDYQLMTEVVGSLIEAGMGLSEKAVREKALKQLSMQYERHRIVGDTPDGAFRKLDRSRYMERLQGILSPSALETEGLAEFLCKRQRTSLKRNVMIGETGSGEHSDLQFPPLSVEVNIVEQAGQVTRPLTVNLHGDTPYLLGEGKDGLPELLVLAPTTKMPDDLEPTKHVLRPFLFYQASLASYRIRPLFEKQGVWISVLYREGVLSWRYKPVRMEDAEAYLKTLVQGFLVTNEFDLLPLVIVKDVAVMIEEQARGPLIDDTDEEVSVELSTLYAQEVQRSLDEDQEGFFPRYRPANINELVKPRVPMDAYGKVTRRLRPVFAYEKATHHENGQNGKA